MKRLLLVLAGCLLMSCAWLPNVFDTDTNPKSKLGLLQNFFNSACEEPCWLEIEVGRTSKEETLDILDENNLMYTVVGATGISVSLESNDLWSTVENPQATIWLENDIVVGFIFPVEVCVSDVFAAHGTPLVSTLHDGLNDLYFLIYPDWGLTYSLASDVKHTNQAHLASREITRANANDANASAWDDNFEIVCE